MDKPVFVMPTRLREVGLPQDQCRVAYGYWTLRVKFARQQRNAIVGLALVLFTVVVKMIQDPAMAAAAASGFTTLMDTLMAWVVPTVLVLCIIALVGTEVVIILLNRKLTNSTFNLKMTPKAVAVVQRMGNSVALHTMLFRRVTTN